MADPVQETPDKSCGTAARAVVGDRADELAAAQGAVELIAATAALGETRATVYAAARGFAEHGDPHVRGPQRLGLCLQVMGDTLFTGSGDKTARSWSVSSGAPIRVRGPQRCGRLPAGGGRYAVHGL